MCYFSNVTAPPLGYDRHPKRLPFFLFRFSPDLGYDPVMESEIAVKLVVFGSLALAVALYIFMYR